MDKRTRTLVWILLLLVILAALAYVVPRYLFIGDPRVRSDVSPPAREGPAGALGKR